MAFSTSTSPVSSQRPDESSISRLPSYRSLWHNEARGHSAKLWASRSRHCSMARLSRAPSATESITVSRARPVSLAMKPGLKRSSR